MKRRPCRAVSSPSDPRLGWSAASAPGRSTRPAPDRHSLRSGAAGITTVNSPLTGPEAKRSRSPAAVPRTISSNCFVISRATTISVSPNTVTDGLERGQDAVRRLVADDGRLEGAERLQAVDAPARLHGQEAVEDEAVGGHAGRGQRGDDGRGPGTGTTPTPASRAARTSRKPGSEMPGVPASVDEAHRFPLAQHAQDGLALAQLVVLEVARDGHVDVEVAQEAPRPPCVLAGDQVDLLEDAERAQGQILEVADRRRDHVERARRHRRFFPGLGGAGARRRPRLRNPAASAPCGRTPAPGRRPPSSGRRFAAHRLEPALFLADHQPHRHRPPRGRLSGIDGLAGNSSTTAGVSSSGATGRDTARAGISSARRHIGLSTLTGPRSGSSALERDVAVAGDHAHQIALAGPSPRLGSALDHDRQPREARRGQERVPERGRCARRPAHDPRPVGLLVRYWPSRTYAASGRPASDAATPQRLSASAAAPGASRDGQLECLHRLRPAPFLEERYAASIASGRSDTRGIGYCARRLATSMPKTVTQEEHAEHGATRQSSGGTLYTRRPTTPTASAAERGPVPRRYGGMLDRGAAAPLRG